MSLADSRVVRTTLATVKGKNLRKALFQHNKSQEDLKEFASRERSLNQSEKSLHIRAAVLGMVFEMIKRDEGSINNNNINNNSNTVAVRDTIEMWKMVCSPLMLLGFLRYTDNRFAAILLKILDIYLSSSETCAIFVKQKGFSLLGNLLRTVVNVNEEIIGILFSIMLGTPYGESVAAICAQHFSTGTNVSLAHPEVIRSILPLLRGDLSSELKHTTLKTLHDIFLQNELVMRQLLSQGLIPLLCELLASENRAKLQRCEVTHDEVYSRRSANTTPVKSRAIFRIPSTEEHEEWRGEGEEVSYDSTIPKTKEENEETTRVRVGRIYYYDLDWTVEEDVLLFIKNVGLQIFINSNSSSVDVVESILTDLQAIEALDTSKEYIQTMKRRVLSDILKFFVENDFTTSPKLLEYFDKIYISSLSHFLWTDNEDHITIDTEGNNSNSGHSSNNTNLKLWEQYSGFVSVVDYVSFLFDLMIILHSKTNKSAASVSNSSSHSVSSSNNSEKASSMLNQMITEGQILDLFRRVVIKSLKLDLGISKELEDPENKPSNALRKLVIQKLLKDKYVHQYDSDKGFLILIMYYTEPFLMDALNTDLELSKLSHSLWSEILLSPIGRQIASTSGLKGLGDINTETLTPMMVSHVLQKIKASNSAPSTGSITIPTSPQRSPTSDRSNTSFASSPIPSISPPSHNLNIGNISVVSAALSEANKSIDVSKDSNKSDSTGNNSSNTNPVNYSVLKNSKNFINKYEEKEMATRTRSNSWQSSWIDSSRKRFKQTVEERREIVNAYNHITNALFQKQNEQKRSYMQYLSRKTHKNRRLLKQWKMLIRKVSHEKALWPLKNTLIKWKLDPTEGPQRMRLRLKPDPIANPYIEEVTTPRASPANSGTYSLSKSLERREPTSPYKVSRKGEEMFENTPDLYAAGPFIVKNDRCKTPSKPIIIAQGSLLSPDIFAAQRKLEVVGIGGTYVTTSRDGDEEEDGEHHSDNEEHGSDEDITAGRPNMKPGERILFHTKCQCITPFCTREGEFLLGDRKAYFFDESRLSTLVGTGVPTKKELSRSGGWDRVKNSKKKLLAGNKSITWIYQEVKEIHKRRYLLKDTALEIFLTTGRTYLLAFQQTQERDALYNKMLAMPLLAREQVGGVVGSPTATSSMTKTIQQKWRDGLVSNFEYLMHLNTLAGRSFNDLTQYPIFPYILRDYTSEELDLTNPSSFRDLSKPMGAQDPDRLRSFIRKYEDTSEMEGLLPGDKPAPYYYGSHYSNLGSVLYYLVRLEPFSRGFLEFQGGKFDIPDRSFHSIEQSWRLSSSSSSSDVKELIPEFFVLPEFLENNHRLDMGVKQSGVRVDHVVLPTWSHGSALEFITKHRDALESKYVSQNIHHWIDLMFGYKQLGEEARKAYNVFHPMTYEGAVDIDAIKDPLEKTSAIVQISSFGQIPKQLFTKPHPERITTLIYNYSTGDRLLRSPSKLNLLISQNNRIKENITNNSNSSISNSNNNNNNSSSTSVVSNNVTPNNSNSVSNTNGPELSIHLNTSIMNSKEDYKDISNGLIVNIVGGGYELYDSLQPNSVNPIQIQYLFTLLKPYTQLILKTDHMYPNYSQNSSISSGVSPSGTSHNSIFLPIPPHSLYLGEGKLLSYSPSFFSNQNLYILPLPSTPLSSSSTSSSSSSNSVSTNSNSHNSINATNFNTITSSNSGIPIQIIETMHDDTILSTSITSNYSYLVTGGTSSLIKIWKLSPKSNASFASSSVSSSTVSGAAQFNALSAPRSILRLHTLLSGHTSPITKVCISIEYNILVSGSEDGTVIIWDIIRGSYIRSLPSSHSSRVVQIGVSKSKGDIVVVWEGNGEEITKSHIVIYTINGRRIEGDKNVSVKWNERICGFGIVGGKGREVAVCGGDKGGVKIVDLRSAKEMQGFWNKVKGGVHRGREVVSVVGWQDGSGWITTDEEGNCMNWSIPLEGPTIPGEPKDPSRNEIIMTSNGGMNGVIFNPSCYVDGSVKEFGGGEPQDKGDKDKEGKGERWMGTIRERRKEMRKSLERRKEGKSWFSWN